MTLRTREALGTIAQFAALLALGLGALLAYAEARFLPASAYAQEHAAIVADVANVRTTAAGNTAEIRGEVKTIRSEIKAQGRVLDRIERAVERMESQHTSLTRRTP